MHRNVVSVEDHLEAGPSSTVNSPVTSSRGSAGRPNCEAVCRKRLGS